VAMPLWSKRTALSRKRKEEKWDSGRGKKRRGRAEEDVEEDFVVVSLLIQKEEAGEKTQKGAPEKEVRKDITLGFRLYDFLSLVL